MKLSLVIFALVAPAMVHAAPLMQVTADCVQTDSRSGSSKSSEFPATVVAETRGDGILTVKVDGPEAAYKGATVIANVKNVELRRSVDGAQAMGTNLETVRLRDRLTKYDVFTSARVSAAQVRLVKMFEYDDSGRIGPKRSWKSVVECTPKTALGSGEITKLVDAVNGAL